MCYCSPKHWYLQGASDPQRPCALPAAAITAALLSLWLTSCGHFWASENNRSDLLCTALISYLRPTHGSDYSDCHVLTHIFLSSVQFSCSVVSDSLRPHGLQHTRPPCPSPTPRVYSNSCPLSRWCYPTISSSVFPSSFCLQSFPASGSFQNESVLHSRWPKYWSFSFNISPSNEHSGLISFRMDWLDLLAVQGTFESLLQHHSSKASIL